MRLSYPIPKTDDDFEHLCCELLKRHWNRPHLQRYGHSGEEQDGIDIFDPTQTAPVMGAQCKLHGYGKTIPPKEIEEEVEKARNHTPPLSYYAILTTAKKSKQADRKVSEINKDHQSRGLFTVEVLTWDQIEGMLDKHPEVRDPLYLPLAHQQAFQIQSQLAAIMLRVETPGGGKGDGIDLELDSIKVEVEGHKLELARQRADQLQGRQGDKLSERQRWRLLTLRGNLHLRRGELEEAGALFIQAKVHQPNEEKAQINEAVGYELRGETAKAHLLVLELRQRFPSNDDVVALWVRTSPADCLAEQLEAEAGGIAARSTNVALALSICLLNRGALEAAERYARRVTEVEPDTPQGWLMLGQSIHMLGFRSAHAADRASRLRAAIRHYDLAEVLARKQGAIHLQAASVMNRAIVRTLLGDPAAEQDYLLAGTMAPNDPDVPRRFAVYLAERNQFERAVEQAGRAAALQDNGDAQATLAAVLWDRNTDNDRQEALALCLRAVSDRASTRFDEALDMAVLALGQFGRCDEVGPLLDSLPPQRVSPVTRVAWQAIVSLWRGDTDKAGTQARQAAAAVTGATSAADIRRVARALVRLSLYAEALPVLQRIADTTRFNPDTRMLLDCANRAGRHQVVLEVCRSLREAGEGDRRLLDNEIDLLQMYDRPAALAVLQGHLSRHPDDRLARLRLSALALQSEQYALVTTDPSQLPPVEDALPSTVGRLVVGLLELAGRWTDAMAFAYALLRRNFGDSDAHGLYCALVLHGERNGQMLPVAEEVQPGVAVAYREQGDSAERWVVVEDNAPQAQLDEYPSTHPLVQRMLGLRMGDNFSLSPTAVQDRRPMITQVVSKYVFRFRDSMDRFQERFPDRGDVQVMRFTRQGGEDADLDLTPLLASLDERRRHVRLLQGTYATHPTPLHLFAEAVGGHLFDAMSHLTATSDAGIRWCCQGGEDERSAARSSARDHRSMVIDLTALFAVCRLDLTGLLSRWQSRQLIVTQATFDRLRGIVQLESAPGPRRRMSAGEQGGYAFHEVPEERRVAYVQSLQRLMEFVRQNCTVAPAPEVASMDSEQRTRLIDLFGRDGLESIVVSARPGNLLWTDDLTLAVIARDDFGSGRRVWTHVLLQVAAEEGLLTQPECDRYGAQLIGLCYAICWCSQGVIEQAGEMAGWRSEVWPLWQVIGLFGRSGMPHQMKVELAARAIVLMTRAVTSPFAREAFIRAILNRLASRQLTRLLAARVDRMFGVDVLTAVEVLEVIRDWPTGDLI
ncbi:MAG: hypothetical protein U0840_28515 [Gemmataceae bacterium]